MKEKLRKTYLKKEVYTYMPIKKIPTCIRLTENGNIKLQELLNYYGFNKSTMIELLITLHHEKLKEKEEI